MENKDQEVPPPEHRVEIENEGENAPLAPQPSTEQPKPQPWFVEELRKLKSKPKSAIGIAIISLILTILGAAFLEAGNTGGHETGAIQVSMFWG